MNKFDKSDICEIYTHQSSGLSMFNMHTYWTET